MAELIINDSNYQDFLAGGIHADGRMTGLHPRNFWAHPFGSLIFAKPFSLPLIPESEWAGRLQSRIAANAQLSDIRNISGPNGGKIPSRDQGQRGYCHTADTEVLTEKGWVTWPEYDWNSLIGTVNPVTGLLEFQKPFERHIYEYDGEMIYSTNRRLDFAVTPDHQMYVRKWDERKRTLSDQYSFVRAADLGWYSGAMHAPKGFIGTELVELGIPNGNTYDGDDLLALISLVCSDGYAGKDDYLVSFCCFNEVRYPMVAALAQRIGFKEQPSRKGVWNYRNHTLWTWIRANCYVSGNPFKAQFKKIPDLVKCASTRQINLFLKFFGDQSHNPDRQKVFYSSSKRMIDDLQELHLRIGKRGTICRQDGKESVIKATGQVVHPSKDQWTLHISSTDQLCIERKKHIEKDHYNGLVYCAGVPNHTLITRRNGSVLVSSNCWAHSPVSAMLLARAIMGEPYQDLSAYSVACIIKNFRDEGGWNSEAVDYIGANGVATSDTWPQQSIDRRCVEQSQVPRQNYKYIEWQELDPRNMKAQLVTCLLMGIPVATDHNFWSHSICTMELVSLSPFRTRIWNSWGDSWSENGTGLLEGSKAVPDNATACIVATAAA